LRAALVHAPFTEEGDPDGADTWEELVRLVAGFAAAGPFKVSVEMF
jgi:hypothetical protein